MAHLREQAESVLFQLNHIAGMPTWDSLPLFSHVDAGTVQSLLDTTASFAEEELLPLAESADKQGCHIEEGRVRLPEGTREVFQKWVDLGYPSLGLPLDVDGLGLPLAVQSAVQELSDGANLALGMLFINLRCAALALLRSANDDQKARWLPGLLQGTLASTIVISEPQAGSDVGRIRTTAREQSDGTYALDGTKIWISYADHDATDEILHLILARTPESEAGSRGLSLFAVPAQWQGEANGTRVARLEHKMGLHASPTCVLELDHARGELIGSLGKGLAALFVMMNAMRLSVAVQGAAVANAATLQAWRYAAERTQGGSPLAPAVPITQHADVRRMLLEMTAESELMRALALRTASLLDRAEGIRDRSSAEATALQQLAEFILPIAKTYNAETAFSVANLGIQIMGGYGYTSDYPMERMARDIRVSAIYEGTSGIQALDLQKRKLLGDKGACFNQLIDEIDKSLKVGSSPFAATWGPLRQHLTARIGYLLGLPKEELTHAEGGAYALLQLLALAMHCWNGHALFVATSGENDHERRLRNALDYFAGSLVQRADLWATRTAQHVPVI